MLSLLGSMVHWWWFGVQFGWWQFRNAVNDRAVIFVRQGPFIDHVLAKRRDIMKEGQIFQYDNGRHAVIAKVGDPLRFWEHERMLGVVDGEVIATVFDIPDLEAVKKESKSKENFLVHIAATVSTVVSNIKAKPDEPLVDPVPAISQLIEGTGKQQDESLISNVIDGHLATELAESPTAPGKGGWSFAQFRWVILIVVALIIIFVVYKFVLHGNLSFLHMGNSTVTTTPTGTPVFSPIWSRLLIQGRGLIGV